MSKRFYYFNSTHWDREWYLPFENFRRQLVRTMDDILKALERGQLEKFTFDGQTIILEDVLEIHPEWRSRIEQAVSSGKLKVGPWYVMPDEFLVSGSSLIHNLLIGQSTAREFGHEPWNIGYICDVFGHGAQTPQIFAGFGLDAAVVWRGTSEDVPGRFFWQSPDGSCCPVINLHHDSGYGAFTIHVSGWWNNSYDTATEFKTRLRKYVEERIGSHYGSAIVLTDGLDHMTSHCQAKEYLKWIAEEYPDSEVIHTDYTEYLREFSDTDPVIRGELIKTCNRLNALQIPHTLSSRYDLKQWNDICQNLLELSTGPALAVLTASGNTSMLAFGRYAWKQLIKNHAHDSICGCSIDAVHRQMLTRFEAIAQVTDDVSAELIEEDMKAVEGKTFEDISVDMVHDRNSTHISPDGRYIMRIWNPLPWERQEVLQLELPIPDAVPYPERWGEPFGGYEQFPNFRLYDENHQELKYRIGAVRRNQLCRIYRSDVRGCTLVPVTTRLTLRSCGWTTVYLEPSKTRPRFLSSMLTSSRSAENAYLKLEIQPDGTFDLIDKRTGKQFRRCNDFLLDREIGDGWNHVRPAGGAEYLSTPNAVSIAVREDSAWRTVFEIIRRLEAPDELSFGTQSFAESPNRAKLEILTTVTLDHDSAMVKIHTSFQNSIKDARLRLSVPTGIPGKYFAYQNFCFLERAAGRATGTLTEEWFESEPLEKNFAGIAGKRDDRGGLAVLTQSGLHELSAPEFDNGELFITLLRAFRTTVGTTGEVDGQLQKQLSFDYALAAMTPQDTNHTLLRLMQNYRAKLISSFRPAPEGKRSDKSFLQISGDVAFCTMEPAWKDDGHTVMLLLTNHSELPRQVQITAAKEFRATRCRLDQTCPEAIAKGTSFTAEIQPDKLATFLLDFRP